LGAQQRKLRIINAISGLMSLPKHLLYLASEQSNEQRNRAESNHPVKPGFSTVSAVNAVDPRWNTIRYKDNGQTKEENNWNS